MWLSTNEALENKRIFEVPLCDLCATFVFRSQRIEQRSSGRSDCTRGNLKGMDASCSWQLAVAVAKIMR